MDIVIDGIVTSLDDPEGTPEPDDDYFTTTPEPCNCDPEGSESQECNSNGICDCKPWLTGDNCDTIKKGAYHTFTIINRMLIHTGAQSDLVLSKASQKSSRNRFCGFIDVVNS